MGPDAPDAPDLAAEPGASEGRGASGGDDNDDQVDDTEGEHTNNGDTCGDVADQPGTPCEVDDYEIFGVDPASQELILDDDGDGEAELPLDPPKIVDVDFAGVADDDLLDCLSKAIGETASCLPLLDLKDLEQEITR